MATRRKPTAYWDYIKTEEILKLQNGLQETDEGLTNDEVLFITVHQIDELWFKLVVRELVAMRDLFAKPHVPEQSLAAAVRGLKRTALLFHQTASHFALMETMTTRDYLAFRDKLSPASGFQSAQLREIEILLGLDDARRLPLGREGDYKEALKNSDGSPSAAFERVARRLAEQPSLKDAIDEWLYRTPIQGSTPTDAGDAEVVDRFINAYLERYDEETRRAMTFARHEGLSAADEARLETRYAGARESARRFMEAKDLVDAAEEANQPTEGERARRRRIRAALVFVESYRELPLLAWPREIIDSLVALEQATVIFRQRHARMVERVIGRRVGTGGSAGVDYLDQTALRYRVFEDIWAVRTIQVRTEALPPLDQPSFYGLVAESQ